MKKLSILLLLSLSPLTLIEAMDYPSKEAAEKAKQEQQRKDIAQKRLNNQLLQAVKAGNLTLVQSLLAQGANPQVKDESGKELRTIASEMGRDDIFNALKAQVPAGPWEGTFLGVVPGDVFSQVSRFRSAADLQDKVRAATNDRSKYTLLLNNPEDFALIWSLLGKPTDSILGFFKYLAIPRSPIAAPLSADEMNKINQLGLNLISVLDIKSWTNTDLNDLYKYAIWDSRNPKLTMALLNRIGNAMDVLGMPIRGRTSLAPIEILQHFSYDSDEWNAVYKRALELGKSSSAKK